MLVLIDAVSVFLGVAAMRLAWRVIMATYSGWFTFRMEPVGYVKMFVFVLIGYLLVLGLDFRRIRKIPMEQALKNAERSYMLYKKTVQPPNCTVFSVMFQNSPVIRERAAPSAALRREAGRSCSSG